MVDGRVQERRGRLTTTRVDIASRREKKQRVVWESCYHRIHKQRIILRSDTPFGFLVDESKESLYGRETYRDLRSACKCFK